jgi:hypothetical protein
MHQRRIARCVDTGVAFGQLSKNSDSEFGLRGEEPKKPPRVDSSTRGSSSLKYLPQSISVGCGNPQYDKADRTRDWLHP